MSKHSPPPWCRCMASDGRCPCGLVWDATGEFVIAHVIRSDENHDKPEEYFLANVRLITEAPELLAALKQALEAFDGMVISGGGVEEWRALIRRIEDGE